MSTDGVPDNIPETTFLLTELRYTLGQLHVQLGDLQQEQLSTDYNGRSVNGVLREMIEVEGRHQQEYAQMLNLSTPPISTTAGVIPTDEDFEASRLATITLLEQVSGEWPEGLADAVRRQVSIDRQHTTEIADLRQHIFSHPSNPNLTKPLMSE